MAHLAEASKAVRESITPSQGLDAMFENLKDIRTARDKKKKDQRDFNMKRNNLILEAQKSGFDIDIDDQGNITKKAPISPSGLDMVLDFLGTQQGQPGSQVEDDQLRQAGNASQPAGAGVAQAPGGTVAPSRVKASFSISPTGRVSTTLTPRSPLTIQKESLQVKRLQQQIQESSPEGKAKAVAAKRKETTANEVAKLQGFRETLSFLQAALAGAPSGPITGRIGKFQQSITGGGIRPLAKLYQDQKPAISAGVYREITGDKRLSDVDAQVRALPMMPDQNEAVQLQALKFAFLDKKLKSREQSLATGKEIKIESYPEIMRDLAQTLKDGGHIITFNNEKTAELADLPKGFQFRIGKDIFEVK